MGVIRWLRDGIDRLLPGRAGVDPFLDASLHAHYERHPLVLLDVGARGGIQEHWRAAEKFLRVIAVQPDARPVESDADRVRPETVIRSALGDRRETREFHLTRGAGKSSFLRPNRKLLERFSRVERWDVVGTTSLAVDTLDRQLAVAGIDDVDFLKLDTQGSEHSILAGAAEILERSVFGLQIEVEFCELYEGQPLFGDVDATLRSLGFELFDLRPIYWKRTAGERLRQAKGQIIFAESLYLRGLASLAASVGALSDPEARRAKLLKAISICVLYGYLDYALEIAEETREQLGADVAGSVRRAVAAIRLPRGIPAPVLMRGGRALGSGTELGNLPPITRARRLRKARRGFSRTAR